MTTTHIKELSSAAWCRLSQTDSAGCKAGRLTVRQSTGRRHRNRQRKGVLTESRTPLKSPTVEGGPRGFRLQASSRAEIACRLCSGSQGLLLVVVQDSTVASILKLLTRLGETPSAPKPNGSGVHLNLPRPKLSKPSSLQGWGLRFPSRRVRLQKEGGFQLRLWGFFDLRKCYAQI